MDTKAHWLGLEFDWGGLAGLVGAGATIIAGLLAVGAAWWTIAATRRAAKAEALERKLAIAARVVAVMETTKAHIEDWRQKKTASSSIIPWSAFTALSADAGLLGLGPVRLLYRIENLAREVEAEAERDLKWREALIKSPGGSARQNELQVEPVKVLARIDQMSEPINELERMCLKMLPEKALSPEEKAFLQKS